MRLEFEQNAPGLPANGSVNHQNDQEKFAELLNAGVKAAQSGDRKSARRHLMSALDIDSQSENAWLWLASISEYPEELLVFLNNVLDINPHNERALQWSASTKLLLSKTLVQRGIDANENGRRDFAVQCFDQALSYDMQNVSAWLWLASLAESDERKMEYFHRILEIEPNNETALEAVKTAESNSRGPLFSKAAWCAAKGDHDGAAEFIQQILDRWPDDKDTWVLRSHLESSFDGKRAAWQRVLELDHENVYASASLESLHLIEAAAEACLNPTFVAADTQTDNETYADANTGDLILSVPDSELIPESNSAFVEAEFDAPDQEVSWQEGLAADDDNRSDDFPLIDTASAPADILESVSVSTNGFASSDATDEILETGAEFAERAGSPFDSVAEPVEVQPEPEIEDDRVKILIVENNPTARKLMAGKLESSGYNVLSAESGREAVDMALNWSPALVLADIAMPGMDGYAICRMLRDRPETEGLPVILISGKDGYYEEDLGEAAGASGFISKPFGPETLMRMVEGFLTNQQ